MAGSVAKTKVPYVTVRKMVDRLNTDDQLALLEHIRKRTWRKEFKTVVGVWRRAAKKHPISDEEIRSECETVRKELCERNRVAGRR